MKIILVGKSACYHVQFLGPLVERAWVYPANLIRFEGKKKFDEYVGDRLKNPRDKNVDPNISLTLFLEGES